MDMSSKIAALTALIAHPKTGPDEKASAERLLERLQRRVARETAESGTAPRRGTGYQLPDVVYGSKYQELGRLYGAELTKVIRADIKLLRDLGRKPSRAGEIKLGEPIGDAPPNIKFSVKHHHYTSVTVTITGVPADWWVKKDYPYPHIAAGPQLKAIGDALRELMWAYNYDGSDAQVDYFNRGFYEKVVADGHPEGSYPHGV
uniref:hypothetical protein n=1 Tax=Nonomuraea sp. CA-251285 TaxID=3240002 RepID=UPI003F493C71